MEPKTALVKFGEAVEVLDTDISDLLSLAYSFTSIGMKDTGIMLQDIAHNLLHDVRIPMKETFDTMFDSYVGAVQQGSWNMINAAVAGIIGSKEDQNE